jgi:hypothetical protein
MRDQLKEIIDELPESAIHGDHNERLIDRVVDDGDWWLTENESVNQILLPVVSLPCSSHEVVILKQIGWS